MALVILNVSAKYSRTTPQRYVLKLNDTPLVRFTHNPVDGMAQCLRDAARALEHHPTILRADKQT